MLINSLNSQIEYDSVLGWDSSACNQKVISFQRNYGQSTDVIIERKAKSSQSSFRTDFTLDEQAFKKNLSAEPQIKLISGYCPDYLEMIITVLYKLSRGNRLRFSSCGEKATAKLEQWLIRFEALEVGKFDELDWVKG